MTWGERIAFLLGLLAGFGGCLVGMRYGIRDAFKDARKRQKGDGST